MVCETLFQGSQQDYIVLLEKRVATLEAENSTLIKLLQQLSPPASGLAEFLPSTQQGPAGPVKPRRHQEIGQIEVLQEDPLINQQAVGSQADGPRDTEDGEIPKWQKKADNILKRFPRSISAWAKKAEEFQLSTPEHVVDVFRILTLRLPDVRFRLPALPQSATPTETLHAYNMLQAELQGKAGFFQQVSWYGRLVFYCITCVACKTQTVKEIDEFVGANSGKRYSSVYLGQLRAAARWAAKLIENLEAKLGERAALLMLLCGPSVETYRQLAANGATESRDYLVEELGNLAHFSVDDLALCFSLAFLVTYLGIGKLSLVNQALGTNLSESDYKRRALIADKVLAEDLLRRNAGSKAAENDERANTISDPPETDFGDVSENFPWPGDQNKDSPSPVSDSSQAIDDRPTIEPCPEKREGPAYDRYAKRLKQLEASEPPTPPPETDISSANFSRSCTPLAPIQTETRPEYDEYLARLGFQSSQHPGATHSSDHNSAFETASRRTHVSLAVLQVAQETGTESSDNDSSGEIQGRTYGAFVATADQDVMLGGWELEETGMDEFMGVNSHLRF